MITAIMLVHSKEAALKELATCSLVVLQSILQNQQALLSVHCMKSTILGHIHLKKYIAKRGSSSHQ